MRKPFLYPQYFLMLHKSRMIELRFGGWVVVDEVLGDINCASFYAYKNDFFLPKHAFSWSPLRALYRRVLSEVRLNLTNK